MSVQMTAVTTVLMILLEVFICFSDQGVICGNKLCQQTYITKSSEKGDISRLECEIPYDDKKEILWIKGNVSYYEEFDATKYEVGCTCIKGSCTPHINTRYKCSVNASAATSSITISRMKRTVDNGVWTTCSKLDKTCRSHMVIVYTFAKHFDFSFSVADGYFANRKIVFISPKMSCQINVTMGCLYPTPVRVQVYFKDKSKKETLLVSSDSELVSSDSEDKGVANCDDPSHERKQYAVINIARENYKEMTEKGIKGEIVLRLNMSCNMTDTPHQSSYFVIFSGSRCECWENCYLVLLIAVAELLLFHLNQITSFFKGLLKLNDNRIDDAFKNACISTVKDKVTLPRILFVTLFSFMTIVIWDCINAGFEPFCKCSEHAAIIGLVAVFSYLILFAIAECMLLGFLKRKRRDGRGTPAPVPTNGTGNS